MIEIIRVLAGLARGSGLDLHYVNTMSRRTGNENRNFTRTGIGIPVLSSPVVQRNNIFTGKPIA